MNFSRFAKEMVTGLVLVFTAVSVQAQNPAAVAAPKKIKMKMDLSIDGRQVAAQEILGAPDTLATVIQKNQNGKELVVEVTPALRPVKGREGVHMKFRIGQRENDPAGATSQVKWFATPEITALNRQEAEITLETDSAADGPRQYRLKVLASIE